MPAKLTAAQVAAQIGPQHFTRADVLDAANVVSGKCPAGFRCSAAIGWDMEFRVLEQRGRAAKVGTASPRAHENFDLWVYSIRAMASLLRSHEVVAVTGGAVLIRRLPPHWEIAPRARNKARILNTRTGKLEAGTYSRQGALNSISVWDGWEKRDRAKGVAAAGKLIED